MRSLERRVQRLEGLKPSLQPLGDHWPPELRGQVIDFAALMRAINGKSRGLPHQPSNTSECKEQPDEGPRQTPQ
jgi:hypothetical protein